MKALGCVLAAIAVAALPGCSLGGGDSGDAKPGAASSTPGPGPKPGEPREAAIIRAWSRAVSAGRYATAASYFAPDSIVVQAGPVKLTDRSAAIAFNKSLPCKSVVTDVKDEGKTIVAAFRLLKGKGPATSCDGPARVRFTFAGNKFKVWRQLPQPAAPSGDTA